MIPSSASEKTIYFKSFETVFARYSVGYIGLSEFSEILNRTLMGLTPISAECSDREFHSSSILLMVPMARHSLI